MGNLATPLLESTTVSTWMCIEVFNGPFAASAWAESHIDRLIEAAVSHGATDWDLKPTAWGVAFEVEFAKKASWSAFRDSYAVAEALRHAPRANDILVYRGRSLDGGNFMPRKPKPKAGSGGATLAFPPTSFFVPDSLDALWSTDSYDARPLTGTR